MLSKVFILLAIAATVVVAQNIVRTEPCRDGSPEPVQFTSDDCTPAGVCTLRRNQIFTGFATFDTQNEINNGTVRVDASLAGFPFPIPIPDGYEIACDFLVGSQCPLAAGTRHVWGIKFPVANNLPAANGVLVELRVVDHLARTIACAGARANIV